MMNQFAQLLSAKCQMPLLLDTCTIVGAWQKKPEVVAFRSKIAKRKDVRIIVPGILVREVAKIAKMSKEEALSLIESFSEFGQIDYVDTMSMARDAEALVAKYPAYCHYPDNHYLACCREQGAVLVTYDNNLRFVAKMEGIMTCAPGNFRIYQ
jgi:predicted nucleic acid-binding protein